MALPPPARDLPAWLKLLEDRHPTSIDLGLERCGAVWRALGAPRPAAQVVTVAGTNGKGSTVRWLCAVLQGLGLSHAAYTSPHLLRFNERLSLFGEAVSDGELVRAFAAVEAARGDMSLTYFEFTTLACLWLMAAAGPDVAVLEVGLGGRLDTVNLIDPDVAVITPVGLDHQAFLGTDREQIGAEKAGILRPGIPVISAEAKPPESVLQAAAELDCDLFRAGQDFRLQAEGERLRFDIAEASLALARPPLAQGHQLDNLAGALAAAWALSGRLPDTEALDAALAATRHPGRLQLVHETPRCWVDVGHNPLAASAVADWLSAETEVPVKAVLAMYADKDALSVAQRLAPVVETFYCAGLEDAERGQSARALADRVQTPGGTQALACGAVSEALVMALRETKAGQGVLVFGSFQTAAEALQWFAQLRTDSAG